MSLSSDSFTNDTFTELEFRNNNINNTNNNIINGERNNHSDTRSSIQNDSSLDIQQLLLNFQENEPIFDNELLYPTPKESEIVHFKNGQLIQGTVEALITYVTSPDVLNYQFLVDFFLTFRTYIDPLPLLELVLCRLSWCLKNSLSENVQRASIGKLVLVRTFVTMRHWLLNHFQDDFINNLLLRQLFANTINELANYKQYIGHDPNNLQSKIIKDLKKNYLTLCSIYWDLNLDIFEISNNDLLHYNILPYNDINNTRLSQMGLNHYNDPSTRRSTLLYMFDNQSSSNLLTESYKQKQSETNPLESFLKKTSLSKSKLTSKIDDNSTFLYPKASLNALEIQRSKSKLSIEDSTSIDQLYSNLCSQPISGFIPLDPTISKNSINDGFTTRGNIEIFEDCKVNKIEPLLKEIKLEKPMGNANPNRKIEIKTISKPSNPTPQRNPKPAQTSIQSTKPKLRNKKRGFLKSLFSHHEKENVVYTSQPKSINIKKEQINQINNSNKDIEKNKEMDNSAIISSTSAFDVIQNLEKKIVIGDKNIDYLEDIVIRDYHIMMQLPAFKQRYSRQIKNSNRKSVLSTAIDLNNLSHRESQFDPHDSPTKVSRNKDYNETQLEQSINGRFNNSTELEHVNENNEKSFQTPPDTINWSESMEVDDSNNNVFIDMGVTNDEVNDISILDNSSNLNNNPHLNNSFSMNNNSYYSNNHIYKNKDKFSQSRASLQLYRNSSKQRQIQQRGKCNSDSHVLDKFKESDHQYNQISNTERDENSFARSTTNTTDNNRFSINVIGRNSVLSNKSYMTYDSDLSISSRNDRFNLSNNKCDENKLRKKNAISNLRINNVENNEINDKYDDHNENANNNDNYNDVNYADTNRNENSNNDDNNTNKNIIDNTDILSKSSLITSNALDMENLHELQELPYYNYIPLNDHSSTGSGISILPSPTPSQTCYNGLSQTDINELAAIPDEKLDGDPLYYTLSKLRGEKSNAKVIIGLNDTNNNEEEIHRKHAVAIVCQSPIKESFNETNIDNTLKDNCDCDSDYDSNYEKKLEKQVRDLYISNNNLNESEEQIPTTPPRNEKVEMNMISTHSFSKNRDNGTKLTRVSTGKLLKDDSEKSCFEMQSLLATPKALNISSQPILTVSQVLKDELHIPFIFKYDSEKLANQMTLIERDIIMEVEWKELINLKWDQPLSPYNSWLRLLLDLSNKTGLQMITLRFNLVNNWIISEILLCKDFTLRVLAITRFIQLAQKCRKIQNYGTLFQIMLALNSEVMKKLKSTWIRIDPGTILRFKELKDLTSPKNNFKNYRDEIEKIIPSKGFIPFLPLELSDLTMYSEMPNIISSKVNTFSDSNRNSTSDELDSLEDFEDGPDSSYELVNFEKFTITGETVKKTLRYIEWSKFYSFETDNEVISKCLYISSLSEEDMEVCLKEIEASSVA